eukprot:1557060-Amphidinium_carterae.1
MNRRVLVTTSDQTLNWSQIKSKFGGNLYDDDWGQQKETNEKREAPRDTCPISFALTAENQECNTQSHVTLVRVYAPPCLGAGTTDEC